MPDEETLRDAITRYIREPPDPPHNPWKFTRQDAARLAEATGAHQEEIERVFFDLCGAVWAGTVYMRKAPDLYANRRMEPPTKWSGTVTFHREPMWDWDTLPKQYPLP